MRLSFEKQSLLYRLRRLSISKRLLLIVCGSIILPQLFLVFLFNRQANQQFTQNTVSYYQNTLYNLENSLLRQTLQVDAALRQVVMNQQIQEALFASEDASNKGAEVQRLLDRAYYQFPDSIRPYIVGFMVVGGSQQYSAKATNLKIAPLSCDRKLLAETPAYQSALQNPLNPVWDAYDQESRIYSYSRQPQIILSQCITVLTGLRGGTDGCLILNLSPAFFSSLYSSDPVSGESVYLNCGKGLVIPVNGSATLELSQYEYVCRSEYGAFRGYERVNLKGKSYLSFYQRTPLGGWTIVAMVKVTDAFQYVTTIRRQSILLTALVLGAAVLMTMVISLSITKPLNRLAHAVSRVGKESLQMDYRDDGEDEIGRLAQRFGQMMERIRELTQKQLHMEIAQRDEQIRRKRFELEALQMQIKPHFLYNTLDIIRWNCLELERSAQSKNHPVSRMVFLLSRILSYGVKHNERLVSIYDEIRHVESYLELLSHTKRYSIRLRIHGSSQLLGRGIVPLTLQPIVENAVLHGLPRKPAVQTLHLHIRETRRALLLSVIDYGCGISGEQLKKIRENLRSGESDAHVGLKNVNERLKLFFGEGSGLSIYSREQVFTSVVIRIATGGTPGRGIGALADAPGNYPSLP